MTKAISINMDAFEQNKKIVAYLKETESLPGLVQNEGQLVMTMWSFSEMGISPAEGMTALWAANAKKWDLPSTMMVLQRGKDIGLSAMESVDGLYPVKGTVACFGATTTKLLIKKGYTVRRDERSETKVTVTLLKDDKEIITVTYTKEDAMRAKLWDSSFTWKQYPTDMLAWKALARAMKFGAADVMGSVHLYEDVIEALDPVEVIGDEDLETMADVFDDDGKDPVAQGAIQLGQPIPADVDQAQGESQGEKLDKDNDNQ